VVGDRPEEGIGFRANSATRVNQRIAAGAAHIRLAYLSRLPLADGAFVNG